MAEVYHVQAKGLSTFINGDDGITIFLDGNQVFKKGRDIQAGDLLAVPTRNIRLSRDEIYSSLEESLRYRASVNILYETPMEGERVPRLRALLLRGLSNEQTDSLEDKIARNGTDFSNHDYSEFATALVSLVGVTQETALKWLRGKRVATEWKNLSKLHSVNPQFKELYDSIGQPAGFHAAFRRYSSIRSIVMADLKRGKLMIEGNGEGSVNEPMDPDCHYETRMILKKFFHIVNDEICAVRVTGIKPIQAGTNGQTILAQVGRIDAPSIDMSQIRDRQYILRSCFYDALNKYCLKKAGEVTGAIEKATFYFVMPFFLSTRLTAPSPAESRSNLGNIATVASISKVEMHEVKSIAHRFYVEFLRKLEDGAVDSIIGTERGTFVSMVDDMHQYRSAMPATYTAWESIDVKIKMAENDFKTTKFTDRSKRREKEKEIQRLIDKRKSVAKYLMDTYSMNMSGKLLFYKYCDMGEGHIAVTTLGDKANNYGATNQDLLVQRVSAQNNGKVFFTKAETQQILTELGMSSAINVLEPKNFIGENVRRLVVAVPQYGGGYSIIPIRPN